MIRFTIAWSFPGDLRAVVEQVADPLADHVERTRIRYDKFDEAPFARPDLDTYLQRLDHGESGLTGHLAASTMCHR